MAWTIHRMNDDGRTTSQQLYIPTLLVVGGCDALVARCRLAAKSTGLAIKACLLKDVAVTVPYRQPLAMVVPNDAFDNASYEIEALARDVRSVLLRVDPEVSVRELEAMIAGAVAGCLSQGERRGGAGRYSITEGLEEEAPFSSRSSAPPSSRVPRSLSSPPSSQMPRSVSSPPSSQMPRSVSTQMPRSVSSPPSSQAPRSVSPPPSSQAPHSVAPPTPRSVSSPGLIAARRPAVAAAVAAAVTEPPPASGAQPKASGPFAALRSLFSSR